MGDYKELSEIMCSRFPEEFHKSIKKMGVFADAYLELSRKTLEVIDEYED